MQCGAPEERTSGGTHMDHHSEKVLNTVLRAAASALIGAGASLMSLTGVRAQTGPLVIAKQGYFFVGGAIDQSREGSPTVGHMYVETRCRSGSRIPIPWS